jgi:flagellar hook protein FlgE
MASFYIPLSGLDAAQEQLQAISSNLANVDTDGYKTQNLTFGDVFQAATSTNGAGDPIQPGNGVTVQSTFYDESDGTAVQTNVPSNMALAGNGYFVVQQSNGSTAYSRAGDFSVTQNGQLTTSGGALVLGYPATAGVVNTSAPVQPLTIGLGAVLPAKATGNFSETTNLDASTGAAVTSNVQVFDSLGNAQELNISYTKTATPNVWNYTVTTPSSAVQSGTGTNTTLASGTLTFNGSGALISSTQAPSTTANAATVPITVGFTPSDGARALSMNWNLADANGNGLITQTAQTGSTGNIIQDGTQAATLSTYTVAADGTIQGTFSTGQTLALGQVAVASVENVQGMENIGNNLLETTMASGVAAVGTAGTGGRGTIKGGYVEQSNVSVATEFSNMIVAQQAYQANAKSVTTFDTLMQTTINMLQS